MHGYSVVLSVAGVAWLVCSWDLMQAMAGLIEAS